MTNPTDEQITEVLATKVLGWRDEWSMWWRKGAIHSGYLSQKVSGPCRYLIFDPLHDANDMAVVLDKMLEMGYTIWTHRWPKNNVSVTIWPPGAVTPESQTESMGTDELMARGLAIAEAVDSEAETDADDCERILIEDMVDNAKEATDD